MYLLHRRAIILKLAYYRSLNDYFSKGTFKPYNIKQTSSCPCVHLLSLLGVLHDYYPHLFLIHHHDFHGAYPWNLLLWVKFAGFVFHVLASQPVPHKSVCHEYPAKRRLDLNCLTLWSKNYISFLQNLLKFLSLNR